MNGLSLRDMLFLLVLYCGIMDKLCAMDGDEPSRYGVFFWALACAAVLVSWFDLWRTAMKERARRVLGDAHGTH